MLTLHEIKQLLDEVFRELPEPVSKCIWVTSQSRVHLMDHDGTTDTGWFEVPNPTSSQLEKLFTIRNPNQKEVGIWTVDGCTILEILANELEDSRCEGVIFTDLEIIFVEFKMNMISFSERAVDKNQKKAEKQLERTIDRVLTAFKQAKLKMPWKIRRAVLVTPHGFPRETRSENLSFAERRIFEFKKLPKQQTRFETAQEKFLTLGFDYREVNSIQIG